MRPSAPASIFQVFGAVGVRSVFMGCLRHLVLFFDIYMAFESHSCHIHAMKNKNS